jgi:hypothetical protein
VERRDDEELCCEEKRFEAQSNRRDRKESRLEWKRVEWRRVERRRVKEIREWR